MQPPPATNYRLGKRSLNKTRTYVYVLPEDEGNAAVITHTKEYDTKMKNILTHSTLQDNNSKPDCTQGEEA